MPANVYFCAEEMPCSVTYMGGTDSTESITKEFIEKNLFNDVDYDETSIQGCKIIFAVSLMDERQKILEEIGFQLTTTYPSNTAFRAHLLKYGYTPTESLGEEDNGYGKMIPIVKCVAKMYTLDYPVWLAKYKKLQESKKPNGK